MERLRSQVTPCVCAVLMPFVDEAAALTVESMLGSELSAASITVVWEVEGFKAVSVADIGVAPSTQVASGRVWY